jgi:dTDP-4-dehydrorhamnose 3,5-epimerase
LIFHPTALPGCFLVGADPFEDERGLFIRTFCAEEFAAQGLDPCVAQCSAAYSVRAGTLRGLHYQLAPHDEVKLVRCTRGRAFDVVVDIRPESPAYTRWVSAELSAENRMAMYVPKGCAHGVLTLEPGTELLYQISAPFEPAAARGIRWDDPAVGIEWPDLGPMTIVMSERDRTWPDLRPATSG